MKRLIALVIVYFTFLFGSVYLYNSSLSVIPRCVSLPKPVINRSFPQIPVVDVQKNFHVVSPGIWRSAQPDEKSLSCLKKMGLKTIINLRQEDSDLELWEREYAYKNNLAYFHFPMDAKMPPDVGQLSAILRILRDVSSRPILIHCYGGRDRTGLVVGVYKAQFTNESLDNIHQEMLMYGYNERAYPLLLETVMGWRDFVRENHIQH